MEDYDMTVALLGVGSAALLVTIYHCLVIVWCNGGRESQSAERTAPQISIGPQEQPSSTEVSTAQLISTHKYQRSVGLEGEDNVCAVCLGEYKEGEDIRTLTECQHSYHAPCIDMWLFSHSNCPLCRTNTTPLLPVSPMLPRGPDSSSSGSQSVMLQGVIIHSINLR